MNKLDILKNYKFQINDRVYSKDMDSNGTVIALSQNIVFNEDINEYEISNWCSVEYDNSTEGEVYNVYEEDLKLIPRELKYPAIYKHFKGQYYATIGISIPTPVNHYGNPLKFVEFARHTEIDESIGICFDDEKYIHRCDESKDILIIYRPLYLNNRKLYAIPLEMFMSEVDREKYPDVIQRYRFEEVK